MAGNKDFLNILREVRGTGAPGATPTDGIWYELTIADIDGNPGVYGDILAKYGIVTESAGTFDQAVAILENLNVEVTTLPAGSEATSALVDGVWQLGIPQGTNGTDGSDGFTPDVTINYVNGNLVYTVTIDGIEVINNTLIDLELLVDNVVNSNVDVQTTLQAKQDVVDAVADAQAISDGLDASVAGKLVEINDHTAAKIGELDSASTAEQAEIVATGDAKIAEYDSNAEDRLQEYDDNHTNKLGSYNANDATKIAEYNYNHTERLDDLNFAYADRIIEMIKTRNFMGIMDEYVAKTATHMITFLDTTDANYIYYANGMLLTENVDYKVYDSKTIELTVKTNPYDVIVQVNTQVLNDMLIAEGALFDDRIGQPNGIAGLDGNGLVPASQLPSYVDDVIEVGTYADLPAIGENDKIYVVVADETQGGNTTSYRWATSTYAIVSNNLTAADVKTLYESNLDTNAFTDAEKTKLAAVEVDTDLNNTHRSSDGSDHTFIDQDVTSSASPTFANIGVVGTVDGRDISVDGAKLDTIEAGATADQTAEEIKTAYESNADTNAFTDAEKTKLAATEISSQLDSRDSANRDRVNHTGTQSIDTITDSASHVKMTVEEQEKVNRLTVTQPVDLDKVEVDTDLNNTHRSSDGSDHTFIDQDVTSSASPTFANIGVVGTVDGRDISVDGAKLDTIEAGATADQTAEEIKTAYESNADTNAFTDADKLEVDTIQSRLDTKQDTLVDGVSIKTINGDGITGSGNLLVSAGASGFAANVYFTDQVSTTVGTYKQLSYTPDELTSELITQVDNTNPVLVEDYVFDGDVVADFIPAGEWQFSFSRKVDNNAGVSRLRFDVFKRSSGGVETVLFSKYSNEIDDTVYTHENIVFIQPSYIVDPTDRIGVKIYAETDRNSLTNVSIQIGDGNAAYLVTPLGLRHNQLRAREELNAHPIKSITGLEDALSDLQKNIDIITSIEEW